MGHLALKSRHQNSWNGPNAESKITLKFKRSSVKQKDKVIHRNGKIITLETNCEVKRMFQYWKSRSVQFIFIKLYKFECALKILNVLIKDEGLLFLLIKILVFDFVYLLLSNDIQKTKSNNTLTKK